jgi:hypothetical protein
MIDYTVIEEEGNIRASFNHLDSYFEIVITDVSEEEIQNYIKTEAENMHASMQYLYELENS